MIRLPHRLLGRLLATVALLGYLGANAEQYLPDDHDWHAADAPAVVATGALPSGPAEPAPGHPVHVCHGAHQHTVGQLPAVAPLLAFINVACALPALEPAAPVSPTPSTPLRPPIV